MRTYPCDMLTSLDFLFFQAQKCQIVVWYPVAPKVSEGTESKLPVRDSERCKRWLRVINNPTIGEDASIEMRKGKTICSLHTGGL